MPPQAPRDRMFHVLVLGGIGLVSGSACGGSLSTHASDAGATDDGAASDGGRAIDTGFPSELGVEVDATVQDTGFPSELPTVLPEAGSTEADASDAASDRSFPAEAQ